MIYPPGYDFAANIHTYQWRDLNICLDVNSGAIHLLDQIGLHLVKALAEHQGDEQAACLSCSQEYPEVEVLDALDEIRQAVLEEALFSNPQELQFDYSSLGVKALCLNVAHLCNMKCRYCFASQGDFGRGKALMSLDVGKRALDFLLEQSGPIRRLEVDFFGGEPLLNIKVVRQLVEYGERAAEERGKQIHFTLTTNGLLLDDDINQFILDKQLSVVLSMDGRPETHDFNRPLPDGSGSYSQVLPRFKALVGMNPASYYIRGTFARHTLNFANDYQHLADLGFDSISLEPAVGTGKEFTIQESDLPEVLAEYERLVDLILEYHGKGREVSFFHFNLDLQKGPCLAKRMTGCGAGVEYLAVTPEGDLYPCHQLVGEEKFNMGNIAYPAINQEIRHRLAASHMANKAECKRCWARNFCGGGCHANNYLSQGDLLRPNQVTCTMHRKRVEAGIYLELRKANSNSGN
ncbi:MAG: thioether cross-link-forming SCIFF peptide maturase [Syntrophomonas sp.]